MNKQVWKGKDWVPTGEDWKILQRFKMSSSLTLAYIKYGYTITIFSNDNGTTTFEIVTPKLGALSAFTLGRGLQIWANVVDDVWDQNENGGITIHGTLIEPEPLFK
jgi:hypothetical protein